MKTPLAWVLQFEGINGDVLRVFSSQPSEADIASAVSMVSDESVEPVQIEAHWRPGYSFFTVYYDPYNEAEGQLWCVDFEAPRDQEAGES